MRKKVILWAMFSLLVGVTVSANTDVLNRGIENPFDAGATIAYGSSGAASGSIFVSEKVNDESTVFLQIKANNVNLFDKTGYVHAAHKYTVNDSFTFFTGAGIYSNDISVLPVLTAGVTILDVQLDGYISDQHHVGAKGSLTIYKHEKISAKLYADVSGIQYIEYLPRHTGIPAAFTRDDTVGHAGVEIAF